ncbi:RNA polymerase sigma factor [Actinomadura rupiterrae]|uniref:RNA polymerase sigma factor n=1 Tax=Actinomadura rupiterrae TaxID=559627 RepID=UPI0020A5B21F|nr:RNA polymerase sigma factor [Actinomadura rupiterrae]MCP2336810.1 RNA polymerase sigma-70 factor (ECF subfamily) [Actinomadura rupiterrae]
MRRRLRGSGGGAVPPPRDAGVHLCLVRDGAYPDWEAVYHDNVRWVYRLMFAKVGNRPDAEDLTAEVFLAALGPLRLSAAAEEVRAYLAATARTVLAAHWRRTLGREITRIEDTDLPAPPQDEPDRGGTAPDRVRRILGALPERYRRVLELRFLNGYSVRETAAELGVSTGNAKVMQHRALRLAADAARENPGEAR